jgi:glycerate dehydrogenase
MKKSAYLLNLARGGLVNEADLAQALQTGVIAWAGLDVVTVEPMLPDNPLLTAPNCIITPHIAWASLAARKWLLVILAENIGSYRQGSPQNLVNQQFLP